MSTVSFVSGAVRVVVPASSANLGPGFDSIGLALAVHDELIAMVTSDVGIKVDVEGEGAGSVATDETNLVVRAMNRGFSAMNATPAGFILKCRNAIPHGRGLGSSASAVIGGLAIARSLVEGGEVLLSDREILNIALEFENHPDNLSAALYGGFNVSWLEGDVSAGAVQPIVHPDIVPIVLIPPHELATTKARGVLPQQVDRSAACHNLSRTGLLVYAISHDPKLLLEATSDRLHQDARSDVYPETTAIIAALRAGKIAAMASGAGPAVLLLVNRNEIGELEDALAVVPQEWTRIAVPVDFEGVRELPLSI
jgi:homoserine kinase